MCVFEEITKLVDEGSPVAIYFDFLKAFVKVPHQRLTFKLKSHGIGISIINWLTDMRHRVVVDGEVSNWKSVLSGESHGSVNGAYLIVNKHE